MTLNIFIVIYSLFLPFITTFKSLIFTDSLDLVLPPLLLPHMVPPFCILGNFTFFFFHLLFKLQIRNLTSSSYSAWKTTFRKALLSNKCANFIKNYGNKLHLLRQNDVTSCFFSNLNCFPLIIDTLNQKSNTAIVFSG